MLRENHFSAGLLSNPHIRSAEFQCTVLNVLNTKISGHPALDKDKHFLKQIGRCCDSAESKEIFQSTWRQWKCTKLVKDNQRVQEWSRNSRFSERQWKITDGVEQINTLPLNFPLNCFCSYNYLCNSTAIKEACRSVSNNVYTAIFIILHIVTDNKSP